MALVGNNCILFKKGYTMRISSIQNKLQLAIFELLNNIGYMNENHNTMFWINIFITVEPTLQYPHINHNHQMLMMNEVCGRNKLKFTNLFLFYPLSEGGMYAEILYKYE